VSDSQDSQACVCTDRGKSYRHEISQVPPCEQLQHNINVAVVLHEAKVGTVVNGRFVLNEWCNPTQNTPYQGCVHNKPIVGLGPVVPTVDMAHLKSVQQLHCMAAVAQNLAEFNLLLHKSSSVPASFGLGYLFDRVLQP